MENQNQEGMEEVVEAVDSTSGTAEQASTVVEKKKTFAILGYIIPFLFFLPLLDDESKDEPFARFHANQQLILFILIVAVQILHSVLFMMLGSLGYMIMNVLSLVIIAFAIFGAFHAYKDQKKELPLIGHFRILK
jgi:uncharacterized membrane protein